MTTETPSGAWVTCRDRRAYYTKLMKKNASKPTMWRRVHGFIQDFISRGATKNRGGGAVTHGYTRHLFTYLLN